MSSRVQGTVPRRSDMRESVARVLGVLLVACAPGLPADAFAVEPDSRLYEAKSNRQRLLFTCKRTEETSGDVVKLTTTYFAPDGTRAVAEEAVLENGKLKRYSMQQDQLKEHGSVEIKGGKVFFSYTRGGETETDEEELTNELLLGFTLHSYLLDRWDALLGGATVKARWVVLDRRETLGFELSKERETNVDGKDAVVVKMVPSSFVIAALVDPVRITLSKDGTELLEIVGRATPKRRVDGTYEDLDAEAVFY